jgi:hypothetical protein
VFSCIDLLWRDGTDLRELPLVERKEALRQTVNDPVLYVQHIAGHGVGLFQRVCDEDMEGIVAKLITGEYEPEATTWVKINNRAYSHAQGARSSSMGVRSVFERLPHSVFNHCRIVIHGKRGGPLEAFTARDEHAHAAARGPLRSMPRKNR